MQFNCVTKTSMEVVKLSRFMLCKSEHIKFGSSHHNSTEIPLENSPKRKQPKKIFGLSHRNTMFFLIEIRCFFVSNFISTFFFSVMSSQFIAFWHHATRRILENKIYFWFILFLFSMFFRWQSADVFWMIIFIKVPVIFQSFWPKIWHFCLHYCCYVLNTTKIIFVRIEIYAKCTAINKKIKSILKKLPFKVVDKN